MSLTAPTQRILILEPDGRLGENAGPFAGKSREAARKELLAGMDDWNTKTHGESGLVDRIRREGVPMAVATDCNPGSSPLSSLLLAMNMACTLFRMTPEETLRGATQHAAAALGLENQGTIEPGNVADLCIWNVKHPAELSYRIGYNPLWKRVCQGQVA